MSDQRRESRPADVVPGYQTVTTLFPYSTAPAWEQILKQDSRRWYLEIIPIGVAVAFPVFLPGTFDRDNPLSLAEQGTWIYKFRDCPSIVTDEWWMSCSGNITVAIVQCLYLR